MYGSSSVFYFLYFRIYFNKFRNHFHLISKLSWHYKKVNWTELSEVKKQKSKVKWWHMENWREIKKCNWTLRVGITVMEWVVCMNKFMLIDMPNKNNKISYLFKYCTLKSTYVFLNKWFKDELKKIKIQNNASRTIHTQHIFQKYMIETNIDLKNKR